MEITPAILIAIISCIGLVGTGLNVWLMLSIRADIAELKLWSVDRFASHTDLSEIATAQNREIMQLRESFLRALNGLNEMAKRDSQGTKT